MKSIILLHLNKIRLGSNPASPSSGDFQSQKRAAHGRYSLYVFSAVAVLFSAALLLPIPGSSAQNGSRPAEKGSEGRGRRALKPPQNVPAAVPNDTCATAIALTAGRSVDGTLATATNDYELSGAGCFTGIGQTATTADGGDAVYSFTATAAANYSFKVTDTSGVGDLVIYTASTCPVGAPPVTVATCQNASNRNVTQASEEVLCQPMAMGETVFIFVDSTSTFPLTTFKIEVTHCQSETEPNSTPATANTLNFGKEASITPGPDPDFFSLGTPSAGSRVFALVDGSAGNGSDFQLRVTTATDTLQFDDDAADFPFGIFAPAIAGRAVTGAPTFLKVDSFNNQAREPYRLYAIVEPDGANAIAGCPAQLTSAIDETEANDTLANANTSPLGYFEGAISSAGDVDLYSFNASVGDLIFMSVDEDPCRNNTPFDSSLSLLDSVGTALMTVSDTEEMTSSTTSGAGNLSSLTPFSPSEALVYRIQVAGTYYARVESAGGSTGDYLLAISRNGAAGVGPTAADGTIIGSITSADGSAVAGAVVRLSGTQNRKTITDANGNYTFNNVETTGFYTVTPSLANYRFSPAERSFSQLGNRTEAVFTASLDVVAGVNPIDTPEYFVRQHYLDFLNREPEEAGFNFWSDQILGCGGDAGCIERKRINVSAAYFLSIEFQQTGGVVDGLYRVSYGRRPLYAEFMPDASNIGQGIVVGRGNWEQQLAANKQAFVEAWVQRAAFQSEYGGLGDDAYVDTLISHTGVSYSQGERDGLVSGLSGGTLSRAGVLQRIVEDNRFVSAKRNEMFVMMEYFGYLRRDPDASGYRFWLDKLNQFNGNFEQAEMVKAFIVSGEYRARFR